MTLFKISSRGVTVEHRVMFEVGATVEDGVTTERGVMVED